MKRNTQKISQAFQRRLLLVVVIAFLVTTAFLWGLQTRMAESNAVDLLKLNLTDVRQDIVDASDKNLLMLTRLVAAELNDTTEIDSNTLLELTERYGISEINVVDENGVIVAGTYPDFLGFQMASGEQSSEFLVLLNGEAEYVQSYQPVSYDTTISRKYAGVRLSDGGFVQVGYDSARFQSDIASQVASVVQNRHVGEKGFLLVTNEAHGIVGIQKGREGTALSDTGLQLTPDSVAQNEVFSATVYGEPCYCMYAVSEGYYIIAVLPQSEAVLSRNVSLTITTVMEVLVFAALFVLIYILIKRLIVNNIYRINGSLTKISDGNLDEVVDVRSHEEFSKLSDDINATVDTLKQYIADAAARIDAELEFARAIQRSALPSVFPPYPSRAEFDLFASMDPAKEVGGDFYDFYFVDEDNLAFLVADVSGKGIPAAMFMMTSKTLLKSCAESGASVEEIFTQVNEKLCNGNDADMFVTAWMGILNTKTGLVTFANAGHNPPLVKRADGSFEFLKSRAGFVLAGMEGIRYRRNEIRLEPGDTLFLYTDGVTEATNTKDELYGNDRLQDLLNQNTYEDAQTLCSLVKADVERFVGDAEQFDDITMLGLRFNGKELEA